MSSWKMHPLLGMIGLFTLCNCQNTLFIGEQHAFDLDVEAKNDASDPAKFNFGYESHTAVVVPPKKPLHSNQQSNPDNVPEGDLLSTLSSFSMLNEKPDGTATKPELTIRTGVATGRAAKAIADQLKGTSSPSPTPAGAKARTGSASASGLLQRMHDIAQPNR
jgi:hypothetical protein